jgi:non-ribosomal peptide synthetase component F
MSCFGEQGGADTGGGCRLSYEDQKLELRRTGPALRNRLAASACAGSGVGPEVIVGLCVERSIEMVVGLLAILKAGGAYLAA